MAGFQKMALRARCWHRRTRPYEVGTSPDACLTTSRNVHRCAARLVECWPHSCTCPLSALPLGRRVESVPKSATLRPAAVFAALASIAPLLPCAWPLLCVHAHGLLLRPQLLAPLAPVAVAPGELTCAYRSCQSATRGTTQA